MKLYIRPFALLMGSLIKPTARVFVTSAVATLILSLCSCSDPSPPVQSKVIPLSAIKGDKITFQMCGEILSLPRSLVSGLRTNEQSGLASSEITIADIYWVKDAKESSPRLYGHFLVDCAKHNVVTKYEAVFTSWKKTKWRNSGLNEYSTDPDQWGKVRTYYQSIEGGVDEKNFTMNCDWDIKSGQPKVCIVRGQLAPRFITHFTASSDSDERLYWREIKDIYTNFINIEKKH